MDVDRTSLQPEPIEAPAPRPDGGRRARARREWLGRRFAPLFVLLWLASWELAARAGWISSLFYPPPSAILAALGDMAAGGVLAENLAASFLRILVGFVVGGGAGLLVGLAMGWSRPLHLALDPLIAAAHPVPRLALLPLILLIFGIGETARILVVGLSCFFPMLINAAAGVRQIEPVYFEVARNFGARPHQVLAHVVVPGSLPSVMAGTRLSLIRALKTTLGIELITSEKGLGHLLWFSWETFHTDDLYAALLVIALVGFAMNSALKRLVARFQPTERTAPA